jgi:hypothetical protein
MPGRALIIGKPEREAIAAALSNARDQTVSMETITNWAASIPQDRTRIGLKDRDPKFKRPPAQEVLIEDGFRVCVSFEDQPMGLCRHLSVSIDTTVHEGLPSHEAVSVLMHEFGIKRNRIVAGWTEEYEPGEWAVNILALEDDAFQQEIIKAYQ